MAYGNTTDLLGDIDPKPADRDLYSPAYASPGQTVDLSGASSIYNTSSSAAPASFQPGCVSRGGPSGSGNNNGGSGYGGGSSSGFGSNSNGYSNSGFRYDGPSGRGPSSIEGGGSGLSLSGLNPRDIMRQLASRPISELVVENGRNLMQLPRYAARAYTATAQRYLRPWNEFCRLRPQRIIEGLRGAQRRGEIQIHFQRNVLANARAFCPNYAFIFLAMMFMFVCTSPMLLCMLAEACRVFAKISAMPPPRWKKTRSKQKNIRKDTRPEEVKARIAEKRALEGEQAWDDWWGESGNAGTHAGSNAGAQAGKPPASGDGVVDAPQKRDAKASTKKERRTAAKGDDSATIPKDIEDVLPKKKKKSDARQGTDTPNIVSSVGKEGAVDSGMRAPKKAKKRRAIGGPGDAEEADASEVPKHTDGEAAAAQKGKKKKRRLQNN